MKVSELFEAKAPGENDFTNTKIDYWLQFLMGGSPGAYQRKKMPEIEKARRAYINGFRYPFGAGSDIGIADSVLQFYKQGEKDGKAERKKFKGEVPPAKLVKNSFGDKKPNQAFEKMIKTMMAPYLEAITVAFKKAEEENVKEGLDEAEKVAPRDRLQTRTFPMSKLAKARLYLMDNPKAGKEWLVGGKPAFHIRDSAYKVIMGNAPYTSKK